MRRKSGKWAILAAAVWLIAAGHVPISAQDSAGALVAGGDPPDLFLLYTGDVIGYIEPCG
jgi:hypothetical protein